MKVYEVKLAQILYPKQFNDNVSFEFNYQVIQGLNTEKTEKTAESHRDYSVSSAYSLCPLRLKASFEYFHSL